MLYSAFSALSTDEQLSQATTQNLGHALTHIRRAGVGNDRRLSAAWKSIDSGDVSGYVAAVQAVGTDSADSEVKTRCAHAAAMAAKHIARKARTPRQSVAPAAKLPEGVTPLKRWDSRSNRLV